MPFYAKVQPNAGVPRFEHLAPYTKVNGIWKTCKQAWVKVAGSWKQFYLAGGVRDTSFNVPEPAYNLNGFVYRMVLQSDKKILVGGSLTSFNGTSIKNIARLNSDQTIDTDFTANLGSGPNTDVRSIAIQSDGKILVGGGFFSFNGQSVGRLVRLNSNGTIDTSFPTNIGFGTTLPLNPVIYAILVQSDGKIIVAGDFQQNAQSQKNIVRLNSDGTIDTQFFNNIGTGVVGSGATVNINALAIQADGKILLGGNFTNFNGSSINRILRLNADGTTDNSFSLNIGTGFNKSVESIEIQQDGKIIVVGRFETFNGVTSRGIIRLNSDGTRDVAFSNNIGTGLDYIAQDVKIQSDNKILVAGIFQNLNDGLFSPRNNILRLNSDGTIDSSVPFGSNYGANSLDASIRALAISTNSDIFIAGSFTSFNSLPATNFAKLNSNLVLTNTGTNGTINSITPLQFEGWPMVVGGNFSLINKSRTILNNIALFDSNGDLNTSTAFNSNVGSGANNAINVTVARTFEGVLIGGSFTSFNNVSVGRVARLSMASQNFGALDTQFNANLGTGANAEVTSAFNDNNGRYVIAGNFTSFNNLSVGRIVRLNSNGTLNTSFNNALGSGANGNIICMASAQSLQFTPYLIIAGDFTSFNGVATNRVAVISESGSRDSSFSFYMGSGPNNTVRAVGVSQVPASLVSGPVFVLGGDFTMFSGISANRLIGLDIDGTPNTTFNNNLGLGANGPVTSISYLKNGQILVGGNFSAFNGFTSKQLVMLNANGTIDTTFTQNFGLGIGPGSSVSPTFGQERIQTIIQQFTSEEVLVGGKFVTFDGADSSSIARFGGDFAS